MKLKQIRSNMTELKIKGVRVLFSYETPVACEYTYPVQAFVTEKKWGRTTSKHITKWLEGKLQYEVKPQEYFNNLIAAVK